MLDLILHQHLQLKQDYPDSFRQVGALTGADALMRNSIFLGTFPGLSTSHKEMIVDEVFDFVKGKATKKIYHN